MPTLNDRYLAALKPDGPARVEHFDDLVPGLAIRVNTGGSKSWVLFYRIRGTRKRWTMGSYPTALSLKAARRKARLALGRLADEGIDPAAEKKQDRRAGDTFKDLAADYMKVAKKTKRSWREDQRILETKPLKRWEGRKVVEITRRDVRAVVEGVAEHAPVMANRVWALVSRIFNYGIEKDWVLANPAARITKQPEASRERVLSDKEVRELWVALDDLTTPRRVTAPADKGAKVKAPAISPMIARGLRVLLMVGQRPGEVFKMRRADLDLTEGNAWWIVPAEHSKNGEPHRVPLSPTVVGYLKDAIAHGPDNNRWVFAGIAGGNVAARAKKAASALRAARVVTFEFHRHDLRRTCATGMAASGIPRTTIAHVLNHVDRGSRATAVYERYDYDAEKRTALEAWERRLGAILTEQDQSRVLPFARA